jgi:hypothetical protein
MKLRCQICGEWIGAVDKKSLAYPMNGTMFTSVDPHHGFEPPFTPAQVWEDFRCPYGPHRPMIKDNEIQTDEGLILLSGRDILSRKTLRTYTCEACDKEFKTEKERDACLKRAAAKSAAKSSTKKST